MLSSLSISLPFVPRALQPSSCPYPQRLHGHCYPPAFSRDIPEAGIHPGFLLGWLYSVSSPSLSDHHRSHLREVTPGSLTPMDHFLPFASVALSRIILCSAWRMQVCLSPSYISTLSEQAQKHLGAEPLNRGRCGTAFGGECGVHGVEEIRPGFWSWLLTSCAACSEYLTPSELRLPLSKRETMIPHKVMKCKAVCETGVPNGPGLPKTDGIPGMWDFYC